MEEDLEKPTGKTQKIQVTDRYGLEKNGKKQTHILIGHSSHPQCKIPGRSSLSEEEIGWLSFRGSVCHGWEGMTEHNSSLPSSQEAGMLVSLLAHSTLAGP